MKKIDLQLWVQWGLSKEVIGVAAGIFFFFLFVRNYDWWRKCLQKDIEQESNTTCACAHTLNMRVPCVLRGKALKNRLCLQGLVLDECCVSVCLIKDLLFDNVLSKIASCSLDTHIAGHVRILALHLTPSQSS